MLHPVAAVAAVVAEGRQASMVVVVEWRSLVAPGVLHSGDPSSTDPRAGDSWRTMVSGRLPGCSSHRPRAGTWHRRRTSRS
uniref:Putative secreted protein n=1 Tax=Anopheles darlingi TaxID=43151 RepID=A0A2M4D6U3_ANODA